MILNCPSCQTSFVVADHLITGQGRMVKCSKCSNTWLAKLPPAVHTPRHTLDTASNLIEKIIPDNPNMLPVLQEERSYKVAILCFLISILAFISVSCIYYSGPILKNRSLGSYVEKSLCTKLNICDTKNIRIKNAKLQKLEGSHNDYMITYNLLNTGKDSSSLPFIKIKILDKNQNVLMENTNHDNNSILPMQQSLVNTKLEKVPSSADKIELSIGNRVEMLSH